MRKFLMIFVMIFSLNNLNAIEIGQKAINFTATTVDGKEISLEQFQGKKAVWLTFWATWCPYCEKEVPALKNLYEKYNDKLEIIAINIGVRDSLENIEAYEMKHDIPYKIIMNNEITREYKVSGTPTQVLIDINGTVVYKGTRVPSNVTDEIIKQITTK
ncbi:MAG: TlpA disulfide reductase family protein [Arcobacteraceae bacterium]